MNIIEAVEAARENGQRCICRRQSNGFTIAIRFVPGHKADFAYFSEDFRLSQIINFWSPSIADLNYPDYDVFRPEKFAIPSADPAPSPDGPLYRLPVKSRDFHDAVRMAPDSEIYSVADDLTDMQSQGVRIPVKTRLQAVLKEIDRREKGRKS